MPVTINGSNTPTAGGITYGDGTQYATTAAGTAGQPLVSGGASAPAFRPYTLPASDGSANQVLQTNGSGALSFATPSGGSWIFLSTVTASNSATVDIDTTFDGTYQNYALVVSNIRPSVDGTTLRMINKLGASFVTSADYIWHLSRPRSGVSTYSGLGSGGSVTSYQITSELDVQTYASSQFIMYIHNPSSTTSFKSVYTVGTVQYNDAYHSNMAGYCGTGNTSALTALRFYMASGNIASGTFRLYGIKNS